MKPRPPIGWSLAIASLCLTGCGEKKPAKVNIPPPSSAEPTTVASPVESQAAKQSYPFTTPDKYSHAKPIYTEVGLASWYGAPYHNRQAATGEIFDMQQLTAAHKTLPLNSICRVTNLSTGQSTIVRINDRGPFVAERILDLSLAAAKAVGVWRPGIATVKLEVLETPADIAKGGRWAVQIGAFKDPERATQLRAKLSHRYQTAKIQQFASPTGEWIRVRVLNDDKKRAQAVARDTHISVAEIFLVRLD